MEDKKISGYLHSKHCFGRSSLNRYANTNYSLAWQWTKHTDKLAIIKLDSLQYAAIKKLLMPVGVVEIQEFEGNKGIVYKHLTNSKNYMQIKRYLIKNKILKETKND